jgi:ABC-type bacteriocin/lantibiotic exporter with double-glycine peptidase domain
VTRHILAVLWMLQAAVASSGPLIAVRTGLDVPIVVQRPERCGQAALEMVLRYYGASAAALDESDRAYDPVLRGSLITDLAAAARRAGYRADIATLEPDSLVALLAAGVPPIILYQNGPALLTVAHFAVVTAWDPDRETFTLNDGEPRPRSFARNDLAKRWRTSGSQALIVRRSPTP